MKGEILRWSACTMNVSIGLKVNLADRKKYFERNRDKTVTLMFNVGDARPDIKVNCDKDSFWNDKCHELISVDLRRWLKDIGELDWHPGQPPQVLIRPDGSGVFWIVGVESRKPKKLSN
jgi:hypothetical protein